MGRFETTVPFYRRFRQPYPRAFFDGLAALLRLDGTQDLVDLGCGPAMLALGFAPHVRSVTGVDPEPAMVEDARAAAAEAGVPLTLISSRTEDIPAGVGPFAVATIGRALHWMEPVATLTALHRLLIPNGAVVVCGTFSAEDQNPWLEAYGALRDSIAPADDKIDYRLKHETFFEGSGFVVAESFSVRVGQPISLDVLAGRLLSMSNTSPAVLGPRAGSIADEVRKAVGKFIRPDGTLAEVVEAKATILIDTGHGR